MTGTITSSRILFSCIENIGVPFDSSKILQKTFGVWTTHQKHSSLKCLSLSFLSRLKGLKHSPSLRTQLLTTQPFSSKEWYQYGSTFSVLSKTNQHCSFPTLHKISKAQNDIPLASENISAPVFPAGLICGSRRVTTELYLQMLSICFRCQHTKNKT